MKFQKKRNELRGIRQSGNEGSENFGGCELGLRVHSKSLFWPDVIMLAAIDPDLMQSVSMAIEVQ